MAASPAAPALFFGAFLGLGGLGVGLHLGDGVPLFLKTCTVPAIWPSSS